MGSERTSLANFSILFLNVAEKSKVCRSGRTWLQIDRTWGSAQTKSQTCFVIQKLFKKFNFYAHQSPYQTCDRLHPKQEK